MRRRAVVPVALSLVLAVGLGSSTAAPAAHARDMTLVTPPTYAAVGDSLTYGHGAETAYPNVAGVDGVGVIGACLTADVCSIFGWFPDAVRHLGQPDVMVALIGINDLAWAGATVSQVKDGLRRLRLDGARLGVRVVLGTLTPPGAGGQWAFIQPRRERVNAWVRRQGDHVDYASVLEGADGYLRPGFDAGDGSHVNTLGERAMGRALARWIRQDTRLRERDSRVTP